MADLPKSQHPDPRPDADPGARPLVGWNQRGRDHPVVVWWAQLDERYLVEVRWSTEHLGRLLMFDHADGDRFVHAEDVVLRLGKTHGPAVGDLLDWQARAEAFADGEGTTNHPLLPTSAGGSR